MVQVTNPLLDFEQLGRVLRCGCILGLHAMARDSIREGLHRVVQVSSPAPTTVDAPVKTSWAGIVIVCTENRLSG